MEIKVLGTGCPNCKTLEKITRDMVLEIGLEASVTKEEDIMKIMEYGIIRTPGLVIDGKVVMSGRIPSVNELKELLTKNYSNENNNNSGNDHGIRGHDSGNQCPVCG